MKKFLFLSVLVGLTLTGCTNDDLLGGEQKNGGNKDAIGFMFQTKNMTRGELQKLQNTHYEFGVFANNGDVVMNNYLVAYADAPLYNTLFAGATTYGDPTSQVDGLSYWFYESLGKTAGTYVHTAYNTPDNDQDLKYWDKSKDAYEFWAYAPYTNTTDGTVAKQNALKVAFDGSDALTFTSLSSFYTNPVAKYSTGNYQIETADVEGPEAITPANYNAEMINYNEGLYAYQKYEVNQYGDDVPLDFKHINAKVNVKFYSDVKGYTVKIIDAVPETLSGSGSFTPAAAEGIQFSPATTLQSWVKMTEAQPALAELPTYYENADVTVDGMSGTTTTIAVAKNASYAPVNKNLVFQKMGDVTIGTTKASATPSPTTLYVLPNKAGTTDEQTETWRAKETRTSTKAIDAALTTWGGSTKVVADSTGYTLHLSYELIPNDGSATITMYDARVFVPAKNCQWEAGKAYTYIFKITKNSNGVTNPKSADDPATRTDATDPTTATEPYVDVTDPRVNDEPGLQPIVFDGVTVTDYVDVDETEYVISETTLDWSIENAFKNIKKLFSAGGTQTGTAIYNAKTGTGVDAANAYVFTLNTKTSDYIDYTTGTITNNCNAFYDVQAMVQALYNEEGIEKIEYPEGTVYTRAEGTTSNGQKIRTFYNGSVRLETAISKEFLADVYSDFNITSKEIKVISANKANPDSPIYIKVKVNNEANETLVGTNVKKVATQQVTNCQGGIAIEGTDGAYTVTLNAVDADLMWPGYPSTDVANTNDNNAFIDIFNFFNGIIGTAAGQVASAEYNSETFGTSNVADLAAAIATYGFAQANPTFATTPKFVKDTYNCGTVTLEGGVTVTLVLDLDVK